MWGEDEFLPGMITNVHPLEADVPDNGHSGSMDGWIVEPVEVCTIYLTEILSAMWLILQLQQVSVRH